MRRLTPSTVVIALLLAWLVAPANAQTSSKRDEIVFVGLRPLTEQGGAGNLPKLAEAQEIRSVLEEALSALTKHPVIGHATLSTAVSKRYLVDWFKCAGRLDCITTVLQPMRAQGYEKGATADYWPNGDNFTVHIFTFTLDDSLVEKDLSFDIAAADIRNPEKWKELLGGLIEAPSGKVRLRSNVPSAKCTLDGKPCVFDTDGKTIKVPEGEHKIELSAEGFGTESVIVRVTAGSEQEAAIALQPRTEGGKTVTVSGAPRKQPKLIAVRADRAPSIDGVIDEAIWQKAWIETNFTQKFPNEGKLPSERTELRVLYDDEALYIGVRCFDKTPDKIVARLTRRDRDIESDRVQIDISSKNDRASAYHFQVNAAGVQVDGLRFNDADYTTDYDSVWYSSTTQDAEGWSAELKIPLVALRYSGDTTSFGFQARRIIQRNNETDEWSYIPRTEKGEVSNYGTLDKLEELRAARLFQLTPYDSRRALLRSNQGGIDGLDFGGNFGADIKIGLTPALTLDATFNPDFGTVEVDKTVLNLFNDEVFFQEKRPFFIEGSEIFATPFQFFYTRRIGRVPPPVAQGDYVETPPQGQILGAGKVTGILTGRLSIGLVEAVTARQDAVIARDDQGNTRKLMVDPLTNFSILRLKQEFASNSSFGVFATAVNRFERAGRSAPLDTDLCPRPYRGVYVNAAPVDGRCTSDAYTTGADTNLRTDDGNYGLSAQFVGSTLRKGPSRFLPDGTVTEPGTYGWGVATEAGKYGGEHWLGSVSYKGARPNLEINDAGFLGAANYHKFYGGLTWRTLEPTGPFLDQSYTLNATSDFTYDFAGKQNRWVYLTTAHTFTNYWSVYGYIGPYYLPYALFRETGDDALAYRPSGYIYNLEVKTDTRKNVIFDVVYFLHHTIRGHEQQVDATINLRPFPALELDVIGSYYSITGSPVFVEVYENPDMTRTYYFQDLDNKTLSTTLRGSYTFTPRLTLQAYVEAFLGTADYGRTTSLTVAGRRPEMDLKKFTNATLPSGFDYDVQEGSLNINMFLRWEYRPGSAFWLVYTRNQNQAGYDPAMDGLPKLTFDRFGNGPTTDVFLAKLSYLWEPLTPTKRAKAAQ